MQTCTVRHNTLEGHAVFFFFFLLRAPHNEHPRFHLAIFPHTYMTRPQVVGISAQCRLHVGLGEV